MHTYFSKKIVASALFVVGLLTLVSAVPEQASAAAVCPSLSGSLNVTLPSGVPSDWCSYVCPAVFPQYLLEKDQQAANADITNNACGKVPFGNAENNYWNLTGRNIDAAKSAFVQAINSGFERAGSQYRVNTSMLTDTWCIPCDKHLLEKAAEPVDMDAFTYQCSAQRKTLFKNDVLPNFAQGTIPNDWCRACFLNGDSKFSNDPNGLSCKSSNPFSEELDRILKSRGIISHGRNDLVGMLESSLKDDAGSPGWCFACLDSTRTPTTNPPSDPGNTPGGYTPSTSNGTFDPLRNPLGEGGIYTISDLISRILTIIATIAIPFAVLAVLWSGFLFIKAQGNPEEIKKASYTLLFTVVGTGLLFAGPKLATAIADTVKEIFQDDLSFQSTTILEQTHIVTLPVSTNRSSLS